jgi:hypothetical protein
MKPVVMATVLLALAGSASAGWFASLDPPRTKVGDAAQPSTSTIPETGRPPVPYVPSPRAPMAARFALPAEPAQDDLSQSTMQPDPSAKLAIERDAHKYVRDLMSSDGPCLGRVPHSIVIGGNGKVSVRC